MREIKFRIWDKELKEEHIERLQDLHEDDYWYDGETEIWNVLHDCNNEQERFVALQYTGLKDKNGNEIYEDDIVEYDDYLWIIEYLEEDGMFILNSKDIIENFSNTDSKWVVVVGNIYENPKLLKGGQANE